MKFLLETPTYRAWYVTHWWKKSRCILPLCFVLRYETERKNKNTNLPRKKHLFSTSATWSVRSVLATSSRDIRQQSRLFLPSWYERWIIEFERTSPYQFGTGAFPVGPTTPGKLSPSSPTAIHAGISHQTTTSAGLQWPSPHTVHDILASNSQSSPSPTSPLCAAVNNNHHHGHHHHHHHQSNDNVTGNNNNEEASGYHHPHHHHHHHQQYYASALYHHHHHHHSDTVTSVATTTPVLAVQSIMMQSSATNSQPASPCN